MLAHRGLTVNAPENTLLSFLNALAGGAEYLETDVQVSKDGIAIICHDSDLRRVAGRREQVSALTLAELKTVDLGSGQTFCTLAEALAAFPEARFNIDIKSLAAAAPAAAAIREAGATGRVLITSFNERRRGAAVRALPGVATSASSPRFALALTAAKLGLSPLVRFALRGVDAVQVPVGISLLRIATRGVIRRIQAAGVEVHFWTINDVTEMKRLLELGADGIVTDRSDLLLELIGRSA
ncbi:glycerophosphodiester phosphodiesterase family protein [Galbitalea soli]|uniref:glycerophosphodiester phosphodiesterase family protein n=1 Tax=Galbitalea soli TaxID=1268042 RepID=UPI00180855C8|nr:glycerophosphoryl diester phosphodiesterase [Galbitalea soli]